MLGTDGSAVFASSSATCLASTSVTGCHEEVRIETWQSGATVSIENERGLEFLVLAGTATINEETLGPQSWGRLPAGMELAAKVGPEAVRIWLKHAPLLHPDVLEMPARR